ncbi:MAG: Do family serine endopeptidase [Burkholderiales bacterium]|nr:Do family serine endopeptidase [Burkholderiales bacterium]
MSRFPDDAARLRAALLAAMLVASSGAPALAQLPAAGGGQPLPSLAPMLAGVTPAVVNIAVVARVPEENPLFADPFFRRFFDLPDRPPRGEQAAGSGVIVDAARGLVVTNHHVVKDAQEIFVGLKDRRVLKAEVVGTDPGTDIAVLRVPPERLTAARWGDSEALNVGDFVVAIGNPFGIGQTVTSGIVSALGRTGLSIEGYEEFIQTDASINPGNSGGALVNLRGELVGINTAIIGPAGGNVGIGFAVPAHMARAVIDQILRFGEVRRGKLGVSTQDVTPDLAGKLGLPVTEGAVVAQIERGSAAERAGLRPRDVVTAIDGRRIRTSSELRNRVGLIPVGEEIELEVLREGRPLRIRARVGELYQVTRVTGETIPQLAGARVANVEPGMPMHGQIEAIVVTAVEEASAAHRNGLRAGDLIVGVNRVRVRSVAELVAAMRTAQRPVRLTLLRGEYRITLLIR